MKHLSPILFFLFPLSLMCQLSGFGLSGGGTASTFQYGDQVQSVDQFDSGSTLGGTGGIQFDFDLGSEMMKFSPEIFIIQNGSEEYFTRQELTNTLIVDRNVQLDYVGLYLPLNFYLPIDDGSDITEYAYNGLNIHLSTFIDYAISGDIRQDDGSEMPINFENELDRIDFGVAATAGFIAGGFSFTFGYNYGLKNIEFNEAVGAGTTDGEFLINNRGFTLAIGYRQKL